MPPIPKSQNIVGPAVSEARRAAHVTQDALAAKCARLGWDISENTITKIETGIRCVTDEELVILAKALKLKFRALFPSISSFFEGRTQRLQSTCSKTRWRLRSPSEGGDFFRGAPARCLVKGEPGETVPSLAR
jgi:DNA-binding XRE family transcriptional regulator